MILISVLNEINIVNTENQISNHNDFFVYQKHEQFTLSSNYIITLVNSQHKNTYIHKEILYSKIGPKCLFLEISGMQK